MHSRLVSLIERGYSVDDVVNLSTYTETELNEAVDMAFKHIVRNCTPVEDKTAIFVGGQPGCGKTVLSMELKNKIGNAVEIGIDNYRMYHPRYLEMEKCIRKHWENKNENINDTPGNDIADFTHVFAGAMTDKLMEKCSKLGYNLILEWGMREPTGPLKSMEDFKNIGYNNLVLFVSTYKDLSYHACELRADVMKDSLRIIRKVPKSFHDHCVETLPDSVNYIYKVGFEKDIIDYMMLITRDGKMIWDNKSNELPGDIYSNYLNNYNYLNVMDNDPKLALNTGKNELSLLLNRDGSINGEEYIYTVVMPNLSAMKR